MRAELERLDCGMEAMFLQHRPQSQGTSARLMFKTGALQEGPQDVPGTAHFLEHVAVLTGTTSYPTAQKLLNAMDRYDTKMLAYTDWTSTWIEVNGLEAEFVIALCMEMGFAPLLGEAAVEQDRTAIMEEARGYLHSPSSVMLDSIYKLFVGDHRSRSVTGSIDDIKSMTPEGIAAFHATHWTPRNARLHVVSHEPLTKLRRYANRTAAALGLVDRVVTEPKHLSLPWLTGDSDVIVEHSFVQDQQAEVFVAYPLANPQTMDENVLDVAATDLLREALWREMRIGKNVTYHAYAGNESISNASHGAKETYNAICLTGAIAPERIDQFLEGIDRLVERLPSLKLLAGNVKREYLYWLAGKSLLTRSELADDLLNADQIGYQKLYDPDLEEKIIRKLRIIDILKRAQEMLMGNRIVHIAGPSLSGIKGIDVVAATRR
ncbi:insulinase family protein [Candidatus Saccharibacteria bacterium]|nr:insulinase family protein [Candidatus Saccharibacteria bacterium]